jgi:hypothetical protein
LCSGYFTRHHHDLQQNCSLPHAAADYGHREGSPPACARACFVTLAFRCGRFCRSCSSRRRRCSPSSCIPRRSTYWKTCKFVPARSLPPTITAPALPPHNHVAASLSRQAAMRSAIGTQPASHYPDTSDCAAATASAPGARAQAQSSSLPLPPLSSSASASAAAAVQPPAAAAALDDRGCMRSLVQEAVRHAVREEVEVWREEATAAFAVATSTWRAELHSVIKTAVREAVRDEMAPIMAASAAASALAAQQLGERVAAAVEAAAASLRVTLADAAAAAAVSAAAAAAAPARL